MAFPAGDSGIVSRDATIARHWKSLAVRLFLLVPTTRKGSKMITELVYVKKSGDDAGKRLKRVGTFDSVRLAKNENTLITLSDVTDANIENSEVFKYKSFSLSEVHHLRVNGVRVDVDALQAALELVDTNEPITDLTELM